MSIDNDRNPEPHGGETGQPEKKAWFAPQLTSESIAGLTENGGTPGSDGLGSSTLS
ncbi:hypothetical protein [Methylomonas methanica]|uniref:Uncharacterized protein n=1 Tax=Methylomonas methanica (strain DSM 25384 / MC09) TaxID=857087 RepID=F9ZVK6_METMM|nr:hypothetical protein [Methylomonas methanica]AEG01988.1 hypothetical protein Metme_3627 [Methylomonas methanica MC09]